MADKEEFSIKEQSYVYDFIFYIFFLFCHILTAESFTVCWWEKKTIVDHFCFP